MAKTWPARLGGGLAGIANGLFGGGGGMVLLPILSRFDHLEPRKLYATCVAVIFPLSLVSAVVYLFRGGVSFSEAAPYLLGGALGGFLGGKLYGRVPIQWFRRLFALFLLYAAVRYLK